MSEKQPEAEPNPEASVGKTEKGPNFRAGLMQKVLGYQVSRAIYVVAQLNLADLLKDEARTVEQLAQETNSNPAALYRLLRMLTMVEVFEETAPHRFALTPSGQLLRKSVPGSLYNMILFFGSPRVWQSWEDFSYSIQTGENATNHVFGVPTWEYYSQHPEEAPAFYNFMTESSNQLGPAVVANYNFGGLGVVADVGGAQGNIIAAILKANPHLKGILFDLPHVTAGASQHLATTGVGERCQVIGGNMFEPWPFKADLYLIARVLHDWDDAHTIAILKNCRQAMGANSKVAVIERILPQDKDAALLYYLSDLHMLVGPGGQERSLQQYQNLFKAAGLNFTRAIPLNPPFSLIEGEPEGLLS